MVKSALGYLMERLTRKISTFPDRDDFLDFDLNISRRVSTLNDDKHACLNRPEWQQQTRLEGWTDPIGTSRVGRRHGVSRWNFEVRSTALGSQETPLGDRGGRFLPELSGRPVQSCEKYRKQSASGN
ncbi:hypothetical protein CRG98_001141 [Punica granatum]|uniref:Uncharacterized protein n=1 Tax=Punica granatum TaxID=22663 RepID=A0A2I0LCU4_PUNGR|nr:hypothetical protein CRG98_001141 [Punica granatum]